jgi:hypothetical protein
VVPTSVITQSSCILCLTSIFAILSYPSPFPTKNAEGIKEDHDLGRNILTAVDIRSLYVFS